MQDKNPSSFFPVFLRSRSVRLLVAFAVLSLLLARLADLRLIDWWPGQAKLVQSAQSLGWFIPGFKPALPEKPEASAETGDDGAQKAESTLPGSPTHKSQLLNPPLAAGSDAQTSEDSLQTIEHPVLALDSFYEKLHRLEQLSGKGLDGGQLKAAPSDQKKTYPTVNIVYYGDSIIWADNITGRLRELLTERFGGAGRGLVPIHNSPDYRLKQVKNTAHAGWQVERLNTDQLKEARVGLTLHSYTAASQARSSWQFDKPGPDKIGLLSAPLSGPGGKLRPVSGKLTLLFSYDDGSEAEENIVLNDIYHEVQAVRSDGLAPNGLTLRATGPARLSGLVMINQRAGIRFSTVIRKGIFSQDFARISRQLFTRQAAALKPDLVVYQFGKNESGWKQFSLKRHLNGITHLHSMLQDSGHDFDMLLVGTAGRLFKKDGGGFYYLPYNDVIINGQKKLAERLGLGFYNSMQALGGKMAFVGMANEGLVLPDYVHLSRRGGDILAGKIYNDLMAGYNDYLVRRQQLPAAQADSEKVQSSSGQSGRLLALFSKDNASAGAGAIYFDSITFIFYLAVVFTVSWLLAVLPALRLFFLLAASWYFYMSWNPVFIVLIIWSSLVDFITGAALERLNEGRRLYRRLVLAASLVSNLGLLFFFKYYNFFYDTLFSLGLSKSQPDHLNLILPVGISFYTFQTMSYTFDLYRRQMKATPSLTRFMLYVSFFPQIIAGPIVRAREFLPQLNRPFRFNDLLVLEGIFMIGLGLFKKTVISDYLAVNLADRVFTGPELYSSLEVLLGVYAYTLQIYCDFSGYTDIAIGAAAMLGYHFPGNFNAPYIARSVSEFWTRWHITLSTWLKDYLYIPLGGNRHGTLRMLTNLMITMVLGGLWHGASLNFILWGGLHGSALIIHKSWAGTFNRIRYGGLRALFSRPGAADDSNSEEQHHRALAALTAPPPGPLRRFTGLAGRFTAWLVTFHFIALTWIFFRSRDFETTGRIFESLAALSSHTPNITASIAAVLVTGFVLHFVPGRLFHAFKAAFIGWPLGLQAAGLVGLAALLYAMAQSELVPFIYFQF